MTSRVEFISRASTDDAVSVKAVRSVRITTEKTVSVSRSPGEGWLSLQLTKLPGVEILSIELIPEDARTVARHLLAEADAIEAEGGSSSNRETA